MMTHDRWSAHLDRADQFIMAIVRVFFHLDVLAQTKL